MMTARPVREVRAPGDSGPRASEASDQFAQTVGISPRPDTGTGANTGDGALILNHQRVRRKANIVVMQLCGIKSDLEFPSQKLEQMLCLSWNFK